MSVFNSISDTLSKLRGEEPISEPLTLSTDTPADLDTGNQTNTSATSLGAIADMVVPTTPSKDFYPMDYEAPILPQAGSIPFHLWESLAYDMALGHPPSEELATAYASTLADLHLLVESPYFNKLLQTKKEEVEEVGPRASTVTKFRVITSMGMREYMRRVTSPATSDKDFHALFKLALEMGELTPPPAPKAGVQIDVGDGVEGMTFNIYSIPGLDHLANTPVETTPDPIDITPEAVEAITADTPSTPITPHTVPSTPKKMEVL